MSGLIAAVNAFAGRWAEALGRASLQGGVAIVVVWILCLAWPRLGPRWRCWLWRLAYLKLFIVFIGVGAIELRLLPDQPSLERSSAAGTDHTLEAAASFGTTDAMSVASPIRQAVTTGQPAIATRPSLAAFGLLVWLAGLGYWASRVQRARRGAARLRSGCRPLADSCCAAGWDELCRTIGLRQPPALLVTEQSETPLLVGVLQPAVVLPAKILEEFTPAQLRLMLAHELAHLKRLDLVWNWLPTLAQGLFFFHPLLWPARRGWRLAQESACDEAAVLATGIEPSEYGSMLLGVASRRPAQPIRDLAAVGIAESFESLQRRFQALKGIRPVTRRRVLVAALSVTVAGLIGVIPWRVVAREPEPAGERGRAKAVAAGSTETDDVLYEGQVLDPDGKPVAAAKLYVGYFDTGTITNPHRGTTGADGKFRFAVAKAEFRSPLEKPWEQSRLLARAEGYGPAFALKVNPGAPEGLSLRLTKDDVPIEGRIVDLQGQPVPGATIHVESLKQPLANDLDGFLKAFAENKAPTQTEHDLLTTWHFGPEAPEIFPVVRTGDDGAFVLKGVGRERVVTLRLEGPKIETNTVNVRTRIGPMFPVPYWGPLPSPGYPNYGASFDHVVGPTAPIAGVIRDRDTGKPIAGVVVREEQRSALHYPRAPLQSTSDANGRYTLVGLPVGRKRELEILSPDDMPYPRTPRYVPKGLAPVTLDFALKRGVFVRGRLFDKATGKPVPGYVEYYALDTNANLADVPRYRSNPGNIEWTDAEGRFRIAAYAGAGLIGAVGYSKGDRNDGYRFGVLLGPVPEHDPSYSLPTEPPFMFSTKYHTVAAISPPAGTNEMEFDIPLDPGRSVSGTILDPEGKPLSGARVRGLEDRPVWTSEPLKSAAFEVRALAPDQQRILIFHHEGRKLVGLLELKATGAGPHQVKLQRWGTATGRVVDAEGHPISDARLDGFGIQSREQKKNLDVPGRLTSDKDGRFRIEGLIPGERYEFWLEKGMAYVKAFESLTVGSNETKDLGDIRVILPR